MGQSKRSLGLSLYCKNSLHTFEGIAQKQVQTSLDTNLVASPIQWDAEKICYLQNMVFAFNTFIPNDNTISCASSKMTMVFHMPK